MRCSSVQTLREPCLLRVSDWHRNFQGTHSLAIWINMAEALCFLKKSHRVEKYKIQVESTLRRHCSE